MRRWEVFWFVLCLAEELNHARQGYGFNFFTYPNKKGQPDNITINRFQIFEKFHELLFREAYTV